MNNVVYIALFLTLLTSCSKEKSVQKKLPGTWTIAYYKYTDAEGFNFYPEFEGRFFFGEDQVAPTYSIGLTISHPKVNQKRVETGMYKITSATKFDLFSTNGNETTTPHLDYEILFISKSDLKIQFTDSLNCVHTLALEK